MTRSRRWPPGLLDEHALTWRAFLVAIPISVIGVLTVLPPEQSIGSEIAVLLGAGALCTLALGAGMVLGHAAVGRARSAASRRGLTALSLLLAGALRGLVLGLTFAALSVPDRASLVTRTVSSGVIFALWLALIGALLSSSARYRAARMVLLEEILTRELQARLLDEERASERRVEAVSRFAQSTDAVRSLLDEVPSTAADYAGLSRSIQRAVDERIRPLVHELWELPPPSVTDERSSGAFLRRAVLSRVPAGWAIVVYAAIVTGAALATLGSAATSVDWQLSLTAGLTETAIVAIAILGERIVRPIPTLPSRVALLMVLLLGPITAAWLAVGSHIAVVIPPLALLSLVGTAPVVVLAACAVQAVVDDRGNDLRELQARLDRDEWREQLQLLEGRAAGVEVASAVHNTLQARLIAAAMQLETAALQGDEARARQALQDARLALDSAGVDEGTVAAPIDVRARAITEAWRGIVDVVITLGPGLDDLPGARLAGDAIEECVANASRHAGARTVSADLQAVGTDLLLVVVDDGAPIATDAVDGLGTAWMTRVSAGRLERVRTEDANRVTLRIAARC